MRTRSAQTFIPRGRIMWERRRRISFQKRTGKCRWGATDGLPWNISQWGK